MNRLTGKRARLHRSRTWRERLFSWPWRPWVKWVTVADGSVSIRDGQIILKEKPDAIYKEM